MIVYYIEQARAHGQNWGRQKIARRFVGSVYFYDRAKSKAIRLGTPVNRRSVILFRASVFDDSIQPPRLIRCDYGFTELSLAGAPLPEFFMDSHQNIVRMRDDVIVLAGPEHKSSTRWFQTDENGFEQNTASPIHPDLTETMKGYYP